MNRQNYRRNARKTYFALMTVYLVFILANKAKWNTQEDPALER